MEIKLSGWTGLLAALVVVGFMGFRYVNAVQTLDTDGREAIREWVASEYQRYHLGRADLSDEEKAAIANYASDASGAGTTAFGELLKDQLDANKD